MRNERGMARESGACYRGLLVVAMIVRRNLGELDVVCTAVISGIGYAGTASIQRWRGKRSPSGRWALVVVDFRRWFARSQGRIVQKWTLIALVIAQSAVPPHAWVSKASGTESVDTSL